jgi:hypothetical protein
VNAVSIDLGASNALLLTGTDVTASGADALTFQSGSNVLAFTPTTALIQSVDNPMEISACNDLAIDTQVFTLTTSSNLTVASACNLTLVAPGGALLVTPSNVALTSDSNIEITSVTDMTIRSENDLYLTAACNLVINASNLSLPLSNFNMDSTGSMNMSAARTMTLGDGSVDAVFGPTWATGTTNGKLISFGMYQTDASSTGHVTIGLFQGQLVTIYNYDGTISPVSVPTYTNGAYVVKYDINGNAQWATTINSGNTPLGRIDVKFSSNGNIHVALSALISTANNIVIKDLSGHDIFTFDPSTYDASTQIGIEVIYTASGIPTNYTVLKGMYIQSLIVDSNGASYLQGNGSNNRTVYNKNGQLIKSISTPGNYGRSIVKLLNGEYQWSCQFQVDPSTIAFNSMYVDSHGNTYVSFFEFGNFTIREEETMVIQEGITDNRRVWLVKISPQGHYLWRTYIARSTLNLSAGNLTGDEFGNVFMSGYYDSASDAPVIHNADDSISSYALPVNGSLTKGCYAIKYNTSGYVQWASSMLGAYWPAVSKSPCLTLNASGELLIGGEYAPATAPLFRNADSSYTTLAAPVMPSSTIGMFVSAINADGTWKDILVATDTSNGTYLANGTEGVQDIVVTGSSIYCLFGLKNNSTSYSTLSFSDGTTIPIAPDKRAMVKLTRTPAHIGTGELYLRSGSNVIAITPTGISLEITNTINATACNNLFTETVGSTVFSVADSLYISASNGLSFQSDSNMSITAFSTDTSLLSFTGDSQVHLWSGANKLSITPTAAQLGDSNSYFTLTNTGIIEQSTTTQVITTSSITIASPDIAADSSATLTLTAQSNFDVTASDVSIATPTGEQKIEFDDGTGILIESADRILVTANDAFSAQGGMLIDGTTHEVFMASQTPTDAVMSSLKCIDSNVIAFASSNQQYFIGSAATGTPILQLTASGTSTFGTQHDIFATNSNVAAITMYRDSNESVLHVLGRVDLDGAINTINKSNLDIVDKVVMFASPDSSNVELTDGMVNERSGIYIYGKPAAASFSNAPQPGDANDVTQRFYEKSMIWNMGAQGMDKLGSATGVDYSTSILNESYWQLRGGNLQLTTAQSDGSNVRDTSYGFRINGRGELELYKHHWLNGEYKAKKLKMWGHMVDSQFPAR